MGEAEEIKGEGADQILPGHGELVLLVEDEVAIMEMSRLMLERIGYQVLAAGTPGGFGCSSPMWSCRK